MIGNIVGDSTEARDEMLGTELVERLMEIISGASAKLNVLQVACWVISNLLKGKPYPSFERVKGLVEHMGSLLFVANDGVISDTLWGLSHFTDEPKEAIKLLRKNVSLAKVVQLMRHENLLIKKPALRIVGNVCVGDEGDVEDAIKNGCLSELVIILNTCEQRDVLKEACWVLSNIAVSSESQVEQLLSSKAIKALVSLAFRKPDLHVFFIRYHID